MNRNTRHSRSPLTHMRSHFCALLLILSTPLSIQAQVESTTLPKKKSESIYFKKLNLRSKLYSSSASSSFYNSKNVGLEIGAAGEQEFFHDFGTEFDLRFKKKSSTSTYLESEHAKYFSGNSSGLSVKDAKLLYSPWKKLLSIEGGIINQAVQNNRILYDRNGELAIRESFNYVHDYFKISLSATQAYPQGDSFSENLDKVDTGNTTFYNEFLRVETNNQELFNLRAQIGHFGFYHLSPTLAYASLFHGNSVAGSSERNAEFAYNFNGWNFTTEGELRLFDNWGIYVTYHLLINNEAPQGKNRGDLIALHPSFTYRHLKFYTEYSFSRIESDAVPGIFSDYMDHPSNMETKSFWIGMEDTKNLFEIKAVLKVSRLIEQRPLIQSNSKSVQLQVSKSYEIF